MLISIMLIAQSFSPCAQEPKKSDPNRIRAMICNNNVVEYDL